MTYSTTTVIEKVDMRLIRRLALVLLLSPTAGMCVEKVTYYYTDANQTILATTDASGVIVTQSDYRPFGAVVLGTPQDGPGFSGHIADVDSSLIYMQARYFDPALGRFIAVDPAAAKYGNVFSFNRYTYGNNNPLHFRDSDGRAPEPILANLTVMRNYVTDAGNRALVGAVQVVNAVMRREGIEANATVLSPVGGAIATTSVYHAESQLGLTPARGEAAEVSLDAKIHILSLDLDPEKPRSSYSITSHTSAHDILGGSVDVSYNLGGKVDAYVGIGIGYGEANYTAAGTLNKTSPESPEMSDSEEQQNIRTELGLGDDHTNMLSL